MAQSAADAEGIVVYNAQHESLTEAWADGFTSETGIKVTLRNGSDTEFGNQIVAGRRRLAGRRVPDRKFAGHGAGRAAGLFAPLDADTLAQVPANFRPANGNWVGIAAR